MTVKKCMESSEASAGEAARLESGHDCSVQSETALYNITIYYNYNIIIFSVAAAARLESGRDFSRQIASIHCCLHSELDFWFM